MYIIKASGKKVKFNPGKVKKTCLRAGADKDLTDYIVGEVSQRVYEGMETRELLRLILRLLKQKNPVVAVRYNLKKAMLDLGPTGFVFEEFILRLLKIYNYHSWFPPLITGACVKHEVDIIARSPLKEKNSLTKHESGQGNIYMIECKYHNRPGLRSGLKDVLYVWARFLDLCDAWRQGKGQKFSHPWLISNTKFSDSAIQYARCKNIRLLGWQYPEGEGLERLIEEKKIYPVTILRSLDRETKEKLFSKKMVLCQDLLSVREEVLRRKLMIKDKTITSLINEARSIIK